MTWAFTPWKQSKGRRATGCRGRQAPLLGCLPLVLVLVLLMNLVLLVLLLVLPQQEVAPTSVRMQVHVVTRQTPRSPRRSWKGTR